MPRQRSLCFLVIVAALLAVSACSFSVSTANIKDVRLARNVDASLTPVDETTQFKVDDATIHAVVTLANAPADTKVKAVWTAVDALPDKPNTQVYSNEITTGTGAVHFSVNNSQSWPAGRYRLDLFLNEKTPAAASRDYTITGAPAAVAQVTPTGAPTAAPTAAPTSAPTSVPTQRPTAVPTATRAAASTLIPPRPTAAATATRSALPTGARKSFRSRTLGVALQYDGSWQPEEEDEGKQIAFAAPDDSGGLLITSTPLDIDLKGDTFTDLFLSGLESEFESFEAGSPEEVNVGKSPAFATSFRFEDGGEEGEGRLLTLTDGKRGVAIMLILRARVAGGIDDEMAAIRRSLELFAPTGPSDATATPAPRATGAAPRPAGTPAAGTLPFEEDFASEEQTVAHGWVLDESDNVVFYWSDNLLTIGVYAPQFVGWNTPVGEYTDFEAETLATVVDAEYAEYGLVFRVTGNTDNRSYYAFAVTTDGQYYLQKKVDGKWAEKNLVELTDSSRIRIGDENTLMVRVQGATITLYINGSRVNSVSDSSIPRGRIGLYTATGDNDFAEVGFSRLSIRKP